MAVLDSDSHLDTHHDVARYEELSTLLDGRFSIGDDGWMLGGTLEPGDNRAMGLFRRSCMPEAAYTLGPEVLGMLGISTRSRSAILGAVAEGFLSHEGSSNSIITAFEPEDWEKLQDGQDVHIPMLIHNYTPRRIVVGRETGDTVRLYRLYSQAGATRLRGNPLQQAVADGSIFIDGEEGRDWRYLHGHPKLGNYYGIAVKIGPDRYYLPPDPEHPEVYLDGEIPLADFRRYSDTVLKPVPPGLNGGTYWIGETVPMVLGVGHYSLIGATLPNGSTQVKSHLLDPGRNWTVDMGRPSGIRVEIQGHLDEHEMPFFFFKDRETS